MISKKKTKKKNLNKKKLNKTNIIIKFSKPHVSSHLPPSQHPH